jgi:hypothetical protein
MPEVTIAAIHAILLAGNVQQGRKRVLRGGAWNNNGHNLRSANRNGNPPDNRNHNIGLRLAGAFSIAGGSKSQHIVQFHPRRAGGQNPGPRRGSRPDARSDARPDARSDAQPLPQGRPLSIPLCINAANRRH